MRFRTLTIAKAVVCLCVGVPILVFPVWLYSLFGATLNEGGVFTAREYGASLIGNLLLAWFGRGAVECELRRTVALALCVYEASGFVITRIALVGGALGPLGWFAAAIYLFFAVGFDYSWLTGNRAT